MSERKQDLYIVVRWFANSKEAPIVKVFDCIQPMIDCFCQLARTTKMVRWYYLENGEVIKADT